MKSMYDNVRHFIDNNSLIDINEKIIIYPYGHEGKLLQSWINTNYPELKVLLMDKNNYGEVISSDRVDNYIGYYFFIASKKNSIINECIHNLLQGGIEDNHIVFAVDSPMLFIDDRENACIDEFVVNLKKERENPKYIVSLTSFPQRISFVSETVNSILNQDFTDFKLILWLAKDEFFSQKTIPKELKSIRDERFEICYCDNCKSYKKLIPTLEKHRNATVITADDDIVFSKEWLGDLIKCHERYPKDIIVHRVTKMVKDMDGRWATHPGGCAWYSGASYLNKLCGGAGTLYPSNSMPFSLVTDRDLFMNLAPTSDDIWFWLMAVKNGVRVRTSDRNLSTFSFNDKTSNTPALTKINDNGEKLFWRHFYNVLYVFPEIEKRLEEEYFYRAGK